MKQKLQTDLYVKITLLCLCFSMIFSLSVFADDTLFKLSNETNALIELPTESTFEISLSLSQAQSSVSCEDTESLFWLESDTNSRFSREPSQTFSTPVCAENVVCQLRSNICVSGESELLSVFSATHSLVSQAGLSSTRYTLCCEVISEYCNPYNPNSDDCYEGVSSSTSSVTWWVDYGTYDISPLSTQIEVPAKTPFVFNATIECVSGECGDTRVRLFEPSTQNDILVYDDITFAAKGLLALTDNPLDTTRFSGTSQTVTEQVSFSLQPQNCFASMNSLANSECESAWGLVGNVNEATSKQVQIEVCPLNQEFECVLSDIIQINFTSLTCPPGQEFCEGQCRNSAYCQDVVCGSASSSYAWDTFAFNEDDQFCQVGSTIPPVFPSQPGGDVSWVCSNPLTQVSCSASRDSCPIYQQWNETSQTCELDSDLELYLCIDKPTTQGHIFSETNSSLEQNTPWTFSETIHSNSVCKFRCEEGFELFLTDDMCVKYESESDACGTQARTFSWSETSYDGDDFCTFGEVLSSQSPPHSLSPGMGVFWTCEDQETSEAVVCFAFRESCPHGFYQDGNICEPFHDPGPIEPPSPDELELHRVCAEVDTKEWLTHFYTREYDRPPTNVWRIELSQEQLLNSNDEELQQITQSHAYISEDGRTFACETDETDICTTTQGFQGCAYDGTCYADGMRIQLGSNNQVIEYDESLQQYDLVCEVNSPGSWTIPPSTCYDSSLSGSVTDSASQELVDVLVSLYYVDSVGEEHFFDSTQTNSQGDFTFEEIPIGNYTLIYEKQSYNNNFVSTSIQSCEQNQDVGTTQLSFGDCRADCTTFSNPNLCDASCHGIGACSFYDETIASRLDGIQLGILHTFSDGGQDYVVNTCQGEPQLQSSSDFTSGTSGTITCPTGQELIIFERIALLDGETVRVRIPVCQIR